MLVCMRLDWATAACVATSLLVVAQAVLAEPSRRGTRKPSVAEQPLPKPPRKPAGDRDGANQPTGNAAEQPGNGTPKESRRNRHRWLTEHPVIQEMWKQCNAERARYGLPPLKLSPSLCLDAQRHAQWMADTGWYQHSALPWAEIIHHGPQTVTDCINGWIYSPPHHGIMLGGFRECGFGYMQRDGFTYWVGMFR